MIQKIDERPLVVQCGHCAQAVVIFMENGENKPPDLLFSGFPEAARMMLSKKTVLLACNRCKGQLDVIVEEYGKTLVL